jgi:Tol biopolymer transport system component
MRLSSGQCRSIAILAALALVLGILPSASASGRDHKRQKRDSCIQTRERRALSAAGLSPEVAADGWSVSPSISDSGRYVAFASISRNLAQGDISIDTNEAFYDIFVTDNVDESVSLISIDGEGAQSEGDSIAPVISGDGQFVAYTSIADTLVAGDTNQRTDVFVYDRDSLKPSRASVRTNGTQANGDSGSPSISDDGRYVVFSSYATNLVGSDSNATSDIFLRDTVSGTTSRISVSSSGTQSNGPSTFPSISDNGNWIAYSSTATNLLGAGGDTNGAADVFLYNRSNGNTTRVSVKNNGAEATGGGSYEPDVSATGRYIAFASLATNLVSNDVNGAKDVFVRDRTGETTMKVSKAPNGSGYTAGNGDSASPSITEDGRYIAFESVATNLWANDTNASADIFEFDTQDTPFRRLSMNSDDLPATGGASVDPSMSADGLFAAFASSASNLSVDDENGLASDVFTHTWADVPRTDCDTDVMSRPRALAALQIGLLVACALLCPSGGGSPSSPDLEDDEDCLTNPADSPTYLDTEATAGKFVVKDFFPGVDNKFLNITDTAYLRFGELAKNAPPYPGWGYRHIARKHGWGPSARQFTNATLLLGEPQAQTKSSWRYHLQYPGANDVSCHSMVLVEWKQEEWAPAPYGIITSFTLDMEDFPWYV